MKLEDWPEHVREFVPPGFDLDNYKRAEQLDMRGWLVELAYRQIGSELIPPNYFGLWQSRITVKDDDIALLMPTGCVHELNMNRAENIYSFLANDPEFSDRYRYTEKAQEAFESFLKENPEMEMGDFEKAFSDHLRLTLGPEPSSYLGEDLFSDRYNYKSAAYLWISLDAPDSLIIDEFSKWLVKVREARGVEPRRYRMDGRLFEELSPNRLQKLSTNRVLAYIDLESWYRVNDQPLPPVDVLQALLFPETHGHQRSESWFAKAVRQPARWLTSPKTIRIFLVQLSLQEQIYGVSRSGT